MTSYSASVIVHLPAGKVRDLRLNSSPLLTDFALRVFTAIVRKWCKPTARAIAAHFERNKDTANAALQSLERTGLVRRWRLSAGKNSFVHMVVVTDEHFAWNTDEEFAAEIARREAAEVAAARAEADADVVEFPPLPKGFPSSGSCPGSSDVTDKKLSMQEKDLSGEPVDNRPSAYDRKLARLLRVDAPVVPHMAPAIALLEGLGVKAPMDRAFYARPIATYLSRGGLLGDVIEFLTSSMDGVRDTGAVLRHRLRRLSASLAAERAVRRGPDGLDPFGSL